MLVGGKELVVVLVVTVDTVWLELLVAELVEVGVVVEPVWEADRACLTCSGSSLLEEIVTLGAAEDTLMAVAEADLTREDEVVCCCC